MVKSLLVPRDYAFDRALAKIKLSRRDLRNVLLEFIGTMLFTIWGSTAAAGGGPWANGLVLAACIYLTDGGMLNICIALSALLTRNLKPHLAFLYICAQLSGAIVGAVWLYALLPTTSPHPGCFYANGITRGQAFAFETLGTFFFVLVVQSIALRFTSFSNPDVDLSAPGSFGGPGPLAIGFALAGIAWSLGQYTGASVNIARTVASPIIFGCGSRWTTGVLVLAELLGTLLASAVAALVYGVGTPIVAIVRPGNSSTTPLLNSVASHVWTGHTAGRTSVQDGTTTV